MRGGNADIWTMNNAGYIVRTQKRLRRDSFTPFNTECPINIDQLEDCRKTNIRRLGSQQQETTDIFKNSDKRQLKDLHGLVKLGSSQSHAHHQS